MGQNHNQKFKSLKETKEDLMKECIEKMYPTISESLKTNLIKCAILSSQKPTPSDIQKFYSVVHWSDGSDSAQTTKQLVVGQGNEYFQAYYGVPGTDTTSFTYSKWQAQFLSTDSTISGLHGLFVGVSPSSTFQLKLIWNGNAPGNQFDVRNIQNDGNTGIFFKLRYNSALFTNFVAAYIIPPNYYNIYIQPYVSNVITTSSSLQSIIIALYYDGINLNFKILHSSGGPIYLSGSIPFAQQLHYIVSPRSISTDSTYVTSGSTGTNFLSFIPETNW